jgi:ribosomal protein S18 acetylase RimI-like enzyme
MNFKKIFLVLCISFFVLASFLFSKNSEPSVTLQIVTDTDYQIFYDTVFNAYLSDILPVMDTENEAREGVQAELAELLPDGIHSDGHFIRKICVNGQRVGFIWYNIDSKHKAELYFLGIDVQYRSKGYGSVALQILESELLWQNVNSVWLNVFVTNQNAFCLYKKAGYTIAAILYKPNSQEIWRYEMQKEL